MCRVSWIAWADQEDFAEQALAFLMAWKPYMVEGAKGYISVYEDAVDRTGWLIGEAWTMIRE